MIPIPQDESISIRAAKEEDLPFVDAMQKTQTKAVGWMPTATLKAKIARKEMLVATKGYVRIGYLIGQDRYFKREDVGIIFQVNVAPEYQRSLVAARLVQAQIDRSAYGCRLYSCWCAQDLEANSFWESLGFVPLAFRTGSPTKGKKGKPRIHIFWQKRVRFEDENAGWQGWWFPSQTAGGSIRGERIVLPIPPGYSWSSAFPEMLPPAVIEVEQLPPPPPKVDYRELMNLAVRRRIERAHVEYAVEQGRATMDDLRASLAVEQQAIETANAAQKQLRKPVPSSRRRTRITTKNAAERVELARELRDRWLERACEDRGFAIEPHARYLTGRTAESRARLPESVRKMLPAA